MSKIKFNILLLICLGMMSASAQTKKTPAAKPATKATGTKFTVSEKKTATPSTDQGIFAEIETAKGKIGMVLAGVATTAMAGAGVFYFYESKKDNKHRKKVFSESEIPTEPKKGDICTNCERPWNGRWHRHHVENDFVGWECTMCNTSKHDQRNKSK
jgi:hypothetical protein